MTQPEKASPENQVATTCPYCGVGCGVRASALTGNQAFVTGDPQHPANFGKLCSKGSALGETVSLDDRLLHPVIAGKRASWKKALDLVAERFSEAIEKHGPNSVAFYVSGQLLTEDYYVANKLMKGFIGSGNIDTNSRLCMSSSVAGHKRAFGADCVPGTYEDLEEADLIVLVGSNLAWCHPVLHQRILAAREKRNTKIVAIDPRATATTDTADYHLPVWPGSDVALFNGLLNEIVIRDALDHDYIDRNTSGFAAAAQEATGWDLDRVAIATGIDRDALLHFYHLFIETKRVVTVYSQGVNQSTAGTDKVNAIINCHLATGRIGRVGQGPFSITGQPNAMGGREVGGLANMLACHMDIDNADHRRIVRDYWNAPRLSRKPGLKAVDMMRAVADGRIKALWVMATNPVDSMPDANAVRDALATCPFVVVSDVTRNTDTTAVADVLLPSLAWGEKDGTVTNSERRISRQRTFIAPPKEARADWWQLAEVANRMGFGDAFAYTGPHEIFSEYAGLSGYRNDGSRDFDISAHAGITAEEYAALEPFQWPAPQAGAPLQMRFFANGGFFTPDRRGNFIATPFRPPVAVPCDTYPFTLNTGRIRDQWHTMTRTAKSPRLASHIAEPFLEIHPEDAARLGLRDADLAEVSSTSGRIVVRALITERQRIGSVFVPMHWNHQFASEARVDALIPGNTDPVSGQPELKCAAVAIRRFDAEWYGFVVTQSAPATTDADYWAMARTKSGWRTELAGREAMKNPERSARQFMRLTDPDAELLSFTDANTGRYRFAGFLNGRLVAAAYFDRVPVALARNFVAEALGQAAAGPVDRMNVLAGRAGAGVKDCGPLVCSCFEVGRNQIIDAVLTGKCLTVEAVGTLLSAGTNCGSCRPEIARIISDHAMAEAS